MKELIKLYNGHIHNRDIARPSLGIIVYKANKEFKYSKTEYKLINILVNGGRYDSYILENVQNKKVIHSKYIVMPVTVSITDWSAKIKAAIDNGNGIIDYKALRKQLETCGIKTIKKALSLYDLAVNGDIAAAYELINYMVTDDFTGKMEGMTGISTLVKLNPFCKLNQCNNESVCSHCYAEQLRKSVAYKMALNTYVLCTYEFTFEQIPFMNCLFFRFESFADILNDTQVINYMNIAKKNSHVHKAIWTKQPQKLHKVIINRFNGIKSENLSIVVSSIKMNCIDTTIKGKYMLPGNIDMVDHVFTVFNAKYAIENNIAIHCINNKCIACKRCYLSAEFYVNEIVKEEQTLYFELLEALNNGNC